VRETVARLCSAKHADAPASETKQLALRPVSLRRGLTCRRRLPCLGCRLTHAQAQRWVDVDGSRKQAQWEVVGHQHREFTDQFARRRTDNVRAYHLSTTQAAQSTGLRKNLNEAVWLAHRYRTVNVLERPDQRLYMAAMFLSCFSFRESYTRNLWIGEGTPGHGVLAI